VTETVYTAVLELAETSEHRVSVAGVLNILGVSVSGYKAWKHRKPSQSELRRNRIKENIIDIYNDSYQNYGAPKITQELRKNGEIIAERTVGKYMKQIGIRAQWVRPYTITTIDPDFSSSLKNILSQQFNPEKPDAVWCSDITYIWTEEGFVYLTSVMDLYSRKIIAWTLSETLESIHVAETVNKAMKRRKVNSPLVLHSDRGSQYVSKAYLEAADNAQLSYSKKGYPYDNACIESFHSLIKREWLNRVRIRDHAHAKRLVFEYIDTFYNTVRIHSHCGYLSPDDFEKLYNNSLDIHLSLVS